MDSPSFKDKLNFDLNNVKQPQPNCQFCECLRLLVFQAKDCIEELKLEVDTWKDACADREAELRSIYHKLFNDLNGLDKHLSFAADIKTQIFDSDRPATAVSYFLTADGQLQTARLKNFIVENKKRIRSRSRANERKHINSTQRNVVTRKSSVKKCKETVMGEMEGGGGEGNGFAMLNDVEVQTAEERVARQGLNNQANERGLLFNDENDQNSQLEEQTPVRKVE